MTQPVRFALMVIATPLLSACLHAQVAVSENHRSITHTCKDGETVSVSGNQNTLHLVGRCGAVELSGNKNQVSLVEARQISTPGNDNVVGWTTGSPQVSNTGSRNQLNGRPGTTAAIRPRKSTRAQSSTLRDGAGNTIRTDSSGSTVLTDSAGNTIVTKPR